ncbi:hypothetical protein AB3S75_002252 [Citrus x aurantiifolia]
MMLQRRLMTSYQQQRITTSPEHIRSKQAYLLRYKAPNSYRARKLNQNLVGRCRISTFSSLMEQPKSMFPIN